MAATGHALLGPSSSHRWLNCTPSARLEEAVKDTGSDFAEEGSCAHALCEEKLWRLKGQEGMADLAFKEQIACNRDRWYTNEMENCADDYVATVWDKYQQSLKTTPDALLFIERQLSFERWIPQSFGTADAIIIADGTMEVIDFKYGKGVEVSAIRNPQMMIYALGAIAEFEDEYNITNVRCTIVQPRIGNLSEFEIKAEELLDWANVFLKPQAELAWEGKGEQMPGEYCRFCKVRARCAKLANQAVAAYTQHEQKELISDEDFPKILRLVPAIKAWASAVEDYATAKAVSGHAYKGFKLVEGRSLRRITDSVELATRLNDNGYTDIYKPQELKSLGDLEKLVGKKDFASLAQGLIDKPKGKPTLVPDTDKRPPITISAADDFNDINL